MRRWIAVLSFFAALACNLPVLTAGNLEQSIPATIAKDGLPASTATPRPENSPPRPTSTIRAKSPLPQPDPDQVLRWLCASNVYDERNPMPGKIVRFAIPIQINPNGSAAALRAIEHYVEATGELVDFLIVDEDPKVGITVMEGDAVGSSQGEPGCGNVTSGKSPTSGHRFQTDASGVFNALTYVHLGSSACDDESKGNKPESVAEHELAHALGVGKHFPDFKGDEGLSSNLTAVVVKLYRLPPGTDMTAACAGVS